MPFDTARFVPYHALITHSIASYNPFVHLSCGDVAVDDSQNPTALIESAPEEVQVWPVKNKSFNQLFLMVGVIKFGPGWSLHLPLHQE